MSKLHRFTTGRVMFECPGCGELHQVIVEGDRKWEWNGSMDKPTFSPSLLVEYGEQREKRVCHSFIRDGQIQFLGDCTHALKGQTVEIPEWDEGANP